ncbi:MAG: disulfide oxidoreductase [Candidatus Doudnabacteria bacterium]
MNMIWSWFKRNVLYFAWGTSFSALVGSMYFSEVKHFLPCTLCWYQRILMYPLVLIIAIAIVKKDRNIADYVLPFTAIGGLIAFYQFLLTKGAIPDTLARCSLSGISCTTKYVEWLGFINIPFMSFVAFGFIAFSVVIYIKENKGR